MWRKVRWIALAFTVVLVGVVGYYGYHLYQFSSHIQKKGEDSIFSQFYPQNTSVEQPAPPKWEGKDRVNIMLLGGDSRGLSKNEVPRSDSNMVVSIDPVTKKAHLFSILRDTYVRIPGFGSDRINAAITLGGPQLAMQTAGDLLGLKIQYYVYTDFQGFMALVDAIDGIDIDVEKDMKYRDSEEPEFDIDLKKGMQHMNGKTALQYVRFRHDAMSDFTRTERQRKFMTAVADKMQSTSSIFKLPSILSSIDPYIETNMTISDMLKLGSLGFDVKASGVKGIQVPPMDLLEEDNVGGASVLTVNREKLQKYVRDEFSGLHDADIADAESDGTGGSTGTGSNSSGGSGSTSGSGSKASGATDGGSSGSKSGSGSTSGSGSKAGSGSSSSSGSKAGSGSTSSSGSKATSSPTSSPSSKPGSTSGSGSIGSSSGSSAGSSGSAGSAGSTGSQVNGTPAPGGASGTSSIGSGSTTGGSGSSTSGSSGGAAGNAGSSVATTSTPTPTPGRATGTTGGGSPTPGSTSQPGTSGSSGGAGTTLPNEGALYTPIPKSL